MKNLNICNSKNIYIHTHTHTHYMCGTQQITTEFDFLKIYGNAPKVFVYMTIILYSYDYYRNIISYFLHFSLLVLSS